MGVLAATRLPTEPALAGCEDAASYVPAEEVLGCCLYKDTGKDAYMGSGCQIPILLLTFGLHRTWTWSELEPFVLGKVFMGNLFEVS